MGASDSDMIACKNAQLAERVERYRERAGHEHRTEAVEDLLRVGLRETQSPLLARLREQAIQIGHLLAVFALIFLAAGVLYQPFPFGQSLFMSVVLVACAVAIPGIIEVARLVRGQNELGAAVREVVR